MQLFESDFRLAPLCREMEARTANQVRLQNFTVTIKLFPNFDSEPEADIRAFRTSPMAYRQSTHTVLVNDTFIWQLPSTCHIGVLAHEIGHAICRRDRLMEQDRYRLPEECIVADLLACTWRFHDELAVERISSYGDEYCEILKKWHDADVFLARMWRWHQRRLASLA